MAVLSVERLIDSGRYHSVLMGAHTTPRARAVVLLSGGLDSATALGVARDEGFECFALSIDYGQRHAAELDAAGRLGAALGVSRHAVVKVDLRTLGGSALTDAIDVPKDRSESQIGSGIPVTYVPARNITMLSIAVGWAETLGSRDVYLGVNQIDYSGYPDCRLDFIKAFEHAAALGTRSGAELHAPVRIHTPLITLSKAGIIRLGTRLGVDFALTCSCYDPVPIDGRGVLACGRCDSCQLRRRGFADAGIPDPTRYAGSMP
jgi:7-cyano-7-deazaguanine synthase